MIYNIEKPLVPLELVQHLIQVFPTKPITIDSTLVEIQREAGKRDVIDYLSRNINVKTLSGSVEDTRAVKETVPELVNPFKTTFLNRVTSTYNRLVRK